MSTKVNKHLGFKKMPAGYDLMLNEGVYYWVRLSDEFAGGLSRDKWETYRGAVKDLKGNNV